MLIGRLITDEQFRRDFLRAPESTLLALCDRGLELSRTEIAALVSTDPGLWGRAAEDLDPRLQKASLENEARMRFGTGCADWGLWGSGIGDRGSGATISDA